MQLRLARASTGAAAERGMVQLVSGEYLDVLGQRPHAGRLLSREDNPRSMGTQLRSSATVTGSHTRWGS